MTVTMTAQSVPRSPRQLKARLRRLGITQAVIATRAGVTTTYVNHFLNGRRPRATRLRDAVAALLAEREDGTTTTSGSTTTR